MLNLLSLKSDKLGKVPLTRDEVFDAMSLIRIIDREAANLSGVLRLELTKSARPQEQVLSFRSLERNQNWPTKYNSTTNPYVYSYICYTTHTMDIRKAPPPSTANKLR
jgi:hypothetical protein